MGQTIVERAQGVLIDPVETFRDARTDDPGDALAYFGALLAVNLVLLCIPVIDGLIQVSGGEPGPIISAVIVSVIADAIGTLVLFVLADLALHLFVALLIGGKGIKETFKVLAYAATPGSSSGGSRSSALWHGSGLWVSRPSGSENSTRRRQGGPRSRSSRCRCSPSSSSSSP